MLASYRWRRLIALPIALFVALALIAITSGSSSATATAKSTSATAVHVKKAKKHLSKAERKLRKHKHSIKEMKKAVRVAAKQKGDRYRYGGTGPGSFDCSGLTQYAFKRAGKHIPRTAGSQYSHLRHIKKAHLKKGDLVYFSNGGHVYHAALFWGKKNGHKLILHASRPGTPVGVSRIWTNSYHAATIRVEK